MTTTTVKCTIRWIYMCFPQMNKLHYITIIHVTLFTMKSVLNVCPVLIEGMAEFVSKPFFPNFLSVALPLSITTFSLDPCMSQLFCFSVAADWTLLGNHLMSLQSPVSMWLHHLSKRERAWDQNQSNTSALTAEHLVIHMFASKKFKFWQEGPSVWTLRLHVSWKMCNVTS